MKIHRRVQKGRLSDKYDDPLYGNVPDSVMRTTISELKGRPFVEPQYEPESPKHLGTNDILSYYGFTEGERNSFLKSFDGDAHTGSDLIKKVFPSIYVSGLHGEFDRTTDRTRELFRNTASMFYHAGESRANFYLENFGAEYSALVSRMARFLDNYGHSDASRGTPIPQEITLEVLISRLGIVDPKVLGMPYAIANLPN